MARRQSQSGDRVRSAGTQQRETQAVTSTRPRKTTRRTSLLLPTPINFKPRSLERDFFARPALTVARELIGKVLCRRIGGEVLAEVIHETEAYIGPQDLAAHGSKGRTARTEIMFGPAGNWYVYFIYGIHWMLNAVTDDVDHPAAVLIRGAGPWTGPAKLTKAMSIDKNFNTLAIDPATDLWIEDRGLVIPRRHIQRTPRIGVDYAGEWAKKPYRFVVDVAFEDAAG